ncbi:MBL fold metallo-hydrolase [Clostridium estertheticum]|uniref:MBL fold metallo-hydrolase n=1 Tax=Clostridium estertheticum TaxID=238834 RepID=UPI001C0B605D|nr:MBL fold metallo-hydrolase [Clostridium estertheticum]MBU3213846.1 MBL fold metallo-hydrolase [Clostridium estertheticum]WAG53726.1 MBL fold metallo-hydrolase [Clostridium estertheticum]
MIIELPVTGVFTTNSYFLIDSESNHGFLIDPGAEANKLLNYIRENNLVIEKILITHSHFDHIGAVKEISEALNIPVYVHEEGKKYIQNTLWNLSSGCGQNITIEATNYMKNNDLIKLKANSKITLRVIYVAGHTLDGVVFYSENEKAAFVGDSIYNGEIGISDYYGGDLVTLLTEVKHKILTMPEDTVLYPGHGQTTTVRRVKNTNSYFRMSD